jgi:hypothetical protein
MRSCKDQWFEAWSEYYDTADRHGIEYTQMDHYYDEYAKALAAGRTYDEHQAYWKRVLNYFEQQEETEK